MHEAIGNVLLVKLQNRF